MTPRQGGVVEPAPTPEVEPPLPEQRPRGRRRGSSDSREAIATAARHLFADRGFDAVSVRSIALAADVDPALVLYFYGSKRELFEDLVQLPFDPSIVTGMLAEGVEGLGYRIARFSIGHLCDANSKERIVSLIRAASTDADTAEVLRERYLRDLLEPLAAALTSDRPELRAALCSSQLVGLAVARHVTRLPALLEADPETLIEIYGATLQHYLTGPLP